MMELIYVLLLSERLGTVRTIAPPVRTDKMATVS